MKLSEGKNGAAVCEWLRGEGRGSVDERDARKGEGAGGADGDVPGGGSRVDGGKPGGPRAAIGL